MSAAVMKRFATRGQAAIFVTLSLPLTLGAVGFVVDLGWAYYRKQACQTAAEAGASAAGVTAFKATQQNCSGGWTCQSDLACPASLTNTADPVQVACLYAKQNGFTNGANGGKQKVSVEANTTASPVAGISPSYWIRVTVSEQLPLTFLSVLGTQWANVASKSTNAVYVPSAGGCIYTLNPTAVDISMNGNTSITTGCGIVDNSNNSGAITIVGANAQITATGQAKVDVVGNVSTHSPSQIAPSPIVGASPIADPFANMVAPASSPCITYSGQAVLSPGTYCNQISMNTGNLTLNPGVYILQGGIDIGGNATLTNNTAGGDGSGGVMLYTTGVSSNVNVHGTPTVTLNAPNTGTYKGVVMWQDQNDTTSANLKGGSTELCISPRLR